MPAFPSVTELIPHREPMLLVDSVVAEDNGVLTCETIIGDDFVFLREGQADIAVTVELVAQTVACIAGLKDFRAGEPPHQGLLVGCQKASFFEPNLVPGDVVHSRAKQMWVKDAVASFEGDVTRTRDGKLLAKVEVTCVQLTKELEAELGF